MKDTPKHISRVAFLCDFFSSLGGTEIYNMTLIRRLKQQGIDVRVYIGERPRRQDWLHELAALGIPVRTPNAYHKSLDSRDIEIAFIEEIADEIHDWKPDVIHVHPFKKMAICWLTSAKHDKTIPIVATEWTVPTKASAHWFEADTSAVVNSVATYIATCHAATNGIRNYHGYMGPIVEIPHLIRSLPTSPSALDAKKPLSVGCVSRLSPEKGIVFLVGAWKKVIESMPDLKLHVYGHGPDESLLTELCKSLGLTDNVIFEGTFAPGTIADITARHAFFVQPSLFESIPTSLIEVMSHGRPVIATKVGGVPELIADGVNGYLVNPASTDEIAERVISLTNDPTSLRLFSVAAFDTIRETYNDEVTFKRILDVYESVQKSKTNVR